MPEIIVISGSEIPTGYKVTIAGPPLAAPQTSSVTSSIVTTSSPTETETSQQSGQSAPPSTSAEVELSSYQISPASSTPFETLPSTSESIAPSPTQSTTTGTTGDATAATSTNRFAWNPASASSTSASMMGAPTPTDTLQSSSFPTGSDIVSTSFEPTPSQMMPQQSDTSTNTWQRPVRSLPTKLVAAAVIPCVIALVIGVLLFCSCKRQRARRKEQQEKLEDHGRRDRSGSPTGDNAVGHPSALMLPKSKSRADKHKTLENAQQSPISHATKSGDPFVSPQSQISFPEYLTPRTPSRGSRTEHDVSADTNGAGLQASARSSIETIIHHPLHQDSDPFTDQAVFEQTDKNQSSEAIVDGRWPVQTQRDKGKAPISDNDDDYQSTDLRSDCTRQYHSTIIDQSQSLPHSGPSPQDSDLGLGTAQDENARTLPPREESDIDLARKVIRVLKKQAFEAQKAAAAAELQAKAMKDAR